MNGYSVPSMISKTIVTFLILKGDGLTLHVEYSFLCYDVYEMPYLICVDLYYE